MVAPSQREMRAPFAVCSNMVASSQRAFSYNRLYMLEMGDSALTGSRSFKLCLVPGVVVMQYRETPLPTLGKRTCVPRFSRYWPPSLRAPEDLS